MLHNHLRNFTSHELAIDFHAADKTDHRADGVDELRARVKITGDHRGGFRDARDTVSLCEYGGGGGNHKCCGKDCSLAFQSVLDVLVHKLFLFCAVKRVDGPLSGGLILCYFTLV